MMRAGHHAVAAAGWLTLAPVLAPHAPAWQVAATTVVAGVTAAGKTSPDMDQRGVSAVVIPGGHRRVTHTVELAVLVAVAGWLAPGIWWRAAAFGWASHVVADAPFGGVPVAVLGMRRVGLRFKTGGPVEWVVAAGLTAWSVWLAAMLVPGVPEFVAALRG